MEAAKKNKAKTIRSIVEWTLIGVLLVFDVFIIAMRFSSSSNGATNFFGNEIFIVQTGSMEGSDEFYESHPEYEIKSAPVNSAVFVKVAPELIGENDSQEVATKKQQAIDAYYGSIKVGDVMTFYYQIGKTVIVTHRVTEIKTLDGKYGKVYEFTLRGDNPSGDKVVSPYSPTQKVNSSTGMVIGKVSKVDIGLGGFIVHFVQNKILIGILIIAPAAIIFIYEIVKIVMILQGNKKAELSSAQDEEIAMLKKQLEEIQEAPAKGDKLSALREYKTMLSEGLITEEEYEKKKHELLD